MKLFSLESPPLSGRQQWGTPEELTAQGEGLEHRLSIKRDKNHVLFSGTKLIQHTGDKEAHIKTPDGACLAVVLRTGFETSQGTQFATFFAYTRSLRMWLCVSPCTCSYLTLHITLVVLCHPSSKHESEDSLFVSSWKAHTLVLQGG